MDELIERLAAEAGINVHADTLCRYEGWSEPMRRFAALVAEECAKIAADTDNGYGDGTCFPAAAAIRAKFKA
jgi:hypothetical protein